MNKNNKSRKIITSIVAAVSFVLFIISFVLERLIDLYPDVIREKFGNNFMEWLLRLPLVYIIALLFVLFIVVFVYFLWLIGVFDKKYVEKSKSNLSDISLKEYFDVPLPLKSGVVIHNRNPLLLFKDIEIELLKISWHKKYEDGEIREIIRDHAKQNNYVLGKWEKKKHIVTSGGHEPVYLVEIINNKAVFFLKNGNQEYENKDYYSNVAESSFEVIFIVRGLLGKERFSQEYAAVFEYRSTKIVPSVPEEIISTIDIKSLLAT